MDRLIEDGIVSPKFVSNCGMAKLAFGALIYVFTSCLFVIQVDAKTQTEFQTSFGCTIFSTGENETKHVCSKFESSLRESVDALIFWVRKDGASVDQRLILKEVEVRKDYIIQYQSAMWTIGRCGVKKSCVKPSPEQFGQVSLSRCEGGLRMFTVYRGLFMEGNLPLKTFEIGVAIMCISDQEVSALISAELFGTGGNYFVILPENMGQE